MPDRSFPCPTCGASLAYEPGTSALKCGHCGSEHEIDGPPPDLAADAFTEHDFRAALRDDAEHADTAVRLELICQSCGAHTQLPENVTTAACAFCGTPISGEKKSARLLRPKLILPFAIPTAKAKSLYEHWLASLWFAPSDLRKLAFLDAALKGIYLPYWTYDAHAITRYTGMKGIDYWVTQSYTVMVNGRPQSRTRRVRKTRWYPAAGVVDNQFDDVLVPATRSLPKDRLDSLEPWDLPRSVPFDDDFLAGFVTESYAVPLDDGFGLAEQRMQPEIDATIRRDIGGDRQIISSKSTNYPSITFKHILLPVWVSAYRYRGKLFQIIINAQTGELSGQRPYSFWKIFFLVLVILIVVGIIGLVVSLSR